MPLLSSSRERGDDALSRGRAPPFAAIDRVARRFDFGNHLAHGCMVRPIAEIGIKKIEPRRTTEKSSYAAIEMYEVQYSPIPRDVRDAAEIFEVDKIHVKAARIVLLDHDVGLLQVARVEAGLVQAADLRGDGVGDLFAAMHVASLDFAGAEHKATERIGVHERAADEVGSSNRAGLIQVHG